MSLLCALAPAVQTAVWGGLGVVAALGLLAALSPERFARIAKSGSSWVDTNKLIEKVDQRIDIDRPILQHSRIFGVVVMASVAVLGYVFYLMK